MKRILIPAICLAAASLASAQSKTPKIKTKNEQVAVQAMIQATNPDDSIAAAENVINKFANTDFKAMAFYIEADSYQQKGDTAKCITFAEQALAADPKYWDAAVLLANVVANTTHDTDLDKDEKIARVTKVANDVIEGLKTADKPNPQMTDDAWTKFKSNDLSQAYQALGILAQNQKKYDEAAADYQKGVDANPDSILMVREARVLMVLKKYDDAIAVFDKALADPNIRDSIKSNATQGKAQAAQLKAQGK